MVSLKCSAFGNPRPTITFYNDGDLVLSPTAEDDQGPWRKSSNHPYASGSYVHMNEIVSHVNISSIRVEDSGEWKCVASNLLSSAAHSARLNVYGMSLHPNNNNNTLFLLTPLSLALHMQAPLAQSVFLGLLCGTYIIMHVQLC